MGVGADGELDARFDCHFAVRVLEVQAPRVCIDLQSGMRLSGVFDHSGNIEVHRFSLPYQPTRGVGDAVDVRVVHRL